MHTRIALILLACSILPFAGASAQPSPDSLLQAFRWRNIGPAAMMGRISAIDAWDEDYRTVLIGSASGGVFKSTNGGITFDAVFDDYGSQSIGDVAFFQPDTSIIWIGTGEATNRNSVGWGDGIYKSTDGGVTFTNMGLKDTYQISEIVTHPTNPDIVYVAALGHLFDYTGSRGLYKTVDGGETWEKLTNGLPDDGRTGATVVTLHPDNPETLFVGMYERLRKAWNMNSGGPNGGLFKSTNGGASWRKLTMGLPTGDTGQIDVDIFAADPNIVMAYIEASDELPDTLAVPGPGVYRSEDGGETWTYQLRHNSRPYYHGRIRINPSDDQLIYVIARDFYYSIDGGSSYEQGRPWGSGGGDDHDLWIDPLDKGVFYMATDQGAYLSIDGGQSLLSFNNMAIGQYYAIGVDMRDPYWVYGGLQDNGGWAIPSNSRDGAGILVDHAIVVNGGDGFHMQADPTDWRTLFTTAHVGMFGIIDMKTRAHHFITPTAYNTVNFDEFYDPDFDEYQTNYSINPQERWLWYDTPQRTINGSNLPPQFRWNWNAPLVMSPTNPRTVYVGSNYLFKSVDRGNTWRIISPDLTLNDPATRNSTNSGGLTKDATGAENHHTIYTIDESPLDPAVVWVGTDDGNVQVTRDGGTTWTNLRANFPGLPDKIWVSRVEASKFDAATAYATFDGHWFGDIKPYVYRTEDFGATWTDLSSGIPSEIPGNSVYTIVEDHKNPDLLFIGTEFGCFVSLNGGRDWHRLMNNLPPVAVHDLVLHPRDNDLIAGTHGRSIWILDDISPLQQLSEEILSANVHLFDNPVATKWLNLSKGRMQNYLKFRGENPRRGASIQFYLRKAPEDTVQVLIEDPLSDRIYKMQTVGTPGINRVRWPMTFLPRDRELETYREGLREMLKVIREGVTETDEIGHLKQIQKDLLATQRYPNRYTDAVYSDLSDARQLSLDHLAAIKIQLTGGTSSRDLNNVREQLLAFSQIVGDRAFFGFYGDELNPTPASAGKYRVTVTMDGRSYAGEITVREDPLMDE